MLKISSEEIVNEVLLLKNLIEEYENNYIYLFKELSDASFSWKEDVHAKEFFTALKYEPNTEINYYKTLIKIYNIFEYISKKYKAIGNRISINIEDRGNILAKFNNCINKTNELIVLYEHLDTSFCPYERQLISNQIKRLSNLKEKYKYTKSIVKSTIDEIEAIEKEVKNRLSKVNVDKVDEFNINWYLPEE